MRLGGFVIHGNNADTLGACLDSLGAVCDEVVAVDSLSTDGSAELARRHGARVVQHPWQGYGAARAAAVRALGSCDYVFFLDSDELLEPPAREAVLRWRASNPDGPVYTARRRNWAQLGTRRFVYRTDTRARLVRRDAAVWSQEMIVHEALPRGDHRPSGVVVEHLFARTLERRQEKDDHYALLWAVQAAARSKRGKPAWAPRLAHFLRDAVLQGALVRGGADGARLAWATSRYHAQKYAFLARVREGEARALVEAYREGRYEALFARARGHRG